MQDDSDDPRHDPDAALRLIKAAHASGGHTLSRDEARAFALRVLLLFRERPETHKRRPKSTKDPYRSAYERRADLWLRLQKLPARGLAAGEWAALGWAWEERPKTGFNLGRPNLQPEHEPFLGLLQTWAKQREAQGLDASDLHRFIAAEQDARDKRLSCSGKKRHAAGAGRPPQLKTQYEWALERWLKHHRISVFLPALRRELRKGTGNTPKALIRRLAQDLEREGHRKRGLAAKIRRQILAIERDDVLRLLGANQRRAQPPAPDVSTINKVLRQMAQELREDDPPDS
jgi:hypothetical protein